MILISQCWYLLLCSNRCRHDRSGMVRDMKLTSVFASESGHQHQHQQIFKVITTNKKENRKKELVEGKGRRRQMAGRGK
jgi:hypothetical protein